MFTLSVNTFIYFASNFAIFLYILHTFLPVWTWNTTCIQNGLKKVWKSLKFKLLKPAETLT